ncbi:MAG: methyltransferase domain-containing protein [Actinomycetota bacterium]|nr:methyltransferase domain-containing protein [Actinomycetota bacterium]
MSSAPDFQAATQAQQAIWSEGDFAMVAGLVYPVSESLVEALDIVPDERVLDVACGSGNGAIAAARRSWGGAVGVDFVPALLERARERAATERLEIEFVEGEAQALPFEDAGFDVTMSIFGAMFAPDHGKAAAELLRVTRPGGRIGLASWCPDGGLQDFFAAITKYTGGPPPGFTPPVLWGAEDHVRELLGDSVADLRAKRLKARQAFRSADHYLDFFRSYFGPIKSAYEKAGPENEGALTADLKAILEELSVGGDRALVVEPEYLQVVATRA